MTEANAELVLKPGRRLESEGLRVEEMIRKVESTLDEGRDAEATLPGGSRELLVDVFKILAIGLAIFLFIVAYGILVGR